MPSYLTVSVSAIGSVGLMPLGVLASSLTGVRFNHKSQEVESFRSHKFDIDAMIRALLSRPGHDVAKEIR